MINANRAGRNADEEWAQFKWKLFSHGGQPIDLPGQLWYDCVAVTLSASCWRLVALICIFLLLARLEILANTIETGRMIKESVVGVGVVTIRALCDAGEIFIKFDPFEVEED